MYLSGGPGGAGFAEMLSVLPSFPYLIDSYRLIGYDQRGTGRSGLLRCDELEKDPQLRDTGAAADVRGADRDRPPALHDAGLGGGHGGHPGRARPSRS